VTVTPRFELTGELKGFDGEAHGVFSASTSYNERGMPASLSTSGAAGNATTSWEYDPNIDGIKAKSIAGTQDYSASYHPDGRTNTVTRALNAVNVLMTCKYTDDSRKLPAGLKWEGDDGVTPEVTISDHKMFGEPGIIDTAGISTLTFGYNPNRQISGVALASALITPSNFSYSYDNPHALRSQLDIEGRQISYTYDDAGRLKTVAQGDIETAYAYISSSLNLIDTITVSKGGSTVLVRDFDYAPNSSMISSVVNKSSSGSAYNSFAYTYYPNTDKIATIALKDGSKWSYSYDGRGQLTGSIKLAPDNAGIFGSEFTYAGDSIANVLKSGRKLFGGDPEATVSPSIFNSISIRTVGTKLQVLGNALEDANVSVNNLMATRDGKKFFLNIDANNQDSAVILPVSIVGALFDPLAVPMAGGGRAGNVPGADLIVEIKGDVYIPKASENPVYDSAGRLAEDSGQRYFWDAEDRLLRVESKILTPSGKSIQVKNCYDYAGRRIKKTVSENGVIVREHDFYYDQVLLDGSHADHGVMVAEKVVSGGATTEYEYVWGLDINGAYQGLGGVGGLLAVVDKTNLKTYLPTSDARGTIHSLIDAATGSVVAEFSYDPYGRQLCSTKSSSSGIHMPFKFQSKYYDQEFGLYNFGLRFYDPSTCKWLNRDPIAEDGGLNLYAFANGDPINNWDYLGCRAYGKDFVGPLDWMDWQESGYTQAEVDKVYAILAERDRHIYNTGLANTWSDREESRLLLEKTLGVPVKNAWNPTFTELGRGIQYGGESIGRNGWTWNPIKMTGNLLGAVLEGTGLVLNVTGVVADVGVAGVEKVPLARKAEPTYIHSMILYNDALEHVMNHTDPKAMVYGWMHSEGAIHGSNIMDTLTEKELKRVTARTFGAGGYMFSEKAYVEHYGNKNSTNRWMPKEDFVPGLAGMNYARNKGDIKWEEAPDSWYVHAFPTYVKYHIIGISKEYFKENAVRIIGR